VFVVIGWGNLFTIGYLKLPLFQAISAFPCVFAIVNVYRTVILFSRE